MPALRRPAEDPTQVRRRTLLGLRHLGLVPVEAVVGATTITVHGVTRYLHRATPFVYVHGHTADGEPVAGWALTSETRT